MNILVFTAITLVVLLVIWKLTKKSKNVDSKKDVYVDTLPITIIQDAPTIPEVEIKPKRQYNKKSGVKKSTKKKTSTKL